MDMKDLTYLVTVAEEGSISRAAEKLFMAQSSLSQALRLYESALGTPIFVRTSRGVRPTAAGEAFVQRSRQILQHYRLAQNEVWDILGLRGGQVALGISTFRGRYLLPPVLRRFRELYPNVHVSITERDISELEKQIRDGLLDIALVNASSEQLRDTEFLMRDEVLVVAVKDHPVMRYAKSCPGQPGQLWVDFRDTAAFEYILGPPTAMLGRIVRQLFQQCGMEPVGQNTSISAAFAADMARSGLGLTLTYRSCLVESGTVEYLRIGEEGVYLDLSLAYPVGEYRSAGALALGALFQEMYERSGQTPQGRSAPLRAAQRY